MFGYTCEIENPQIYWGARGIFERKLKYHKGKLDDIYYDFDLLPDRQDTICLDESIKTEFFKWINEEAIPALRKHIKEDHWMAECEKLFELENEKFIFKATPNGSCGYIFLGAWQVKPAHP